MDVEIHPWKPSQAGRNPRGSRLRSRTWTGAGPVSGAVVASGSRARQGGSTHSWNTGISDQRHATRQYSHDAAVSDVSQNNNNNRQDGERTRLSALFDTCTL